jgi:uncharacterized RDD family membrane protein YckC
MINRQTAERSPMASQDLLGSYAGFISRCLAMVIDSLIISFSFIALTWFVSVTTTMLQLRTFLGFSFNAIPGFTGFLDFLFGPVSAGLLTGVYILSYHVFFWTLTGQTPGKALLGVRVVTTDGKRISPWRGILRFCGYFLAAIPLGIGLLWMLVDDQRQGWQDKVAGTYVIYTWAAQPDEQFLADEIRELHRVSQHQKMGSGKD